MGEPYFKWEALYLWGDHHQPPNHKFSMMNHTSTLKRLRLKEILGKCERKKFSQGVGVPGLPRENNVVARYQEFFSTPPPVVDHPITILAWGEDRPI